MLSRIFWITALFLSLIACSSKKAKDEKGALPESAVSSEAMSFDAQGSDSGKIEGLTTIHFDFNKAILTSHEREVLVKNAEWIKAHRSVSISIEGNCDLKGSTEYNLALGERRARVAKEYLLSLGVGPDQISVVSFGKEKPLTMNDSEEEQAKNRRDNFVPLKK